MKYQIQGDTLPVVICQLEAGESMITESGSMSWMSPNMLMETTAAASVRHSGGSFPAKISSKIFIQHRAGPGMIAFASSFPGSIRAFQIHPGQEMIFQKSAFLASERGIELSVHFRKKFSAGLFGGEGFIMQRVSGEGIVFAEFDGHVVEYDLLPGQQMIVDTGYLAAMSASCTMDVQTVHGAKNILFGGEGLFNTVVTGPGRIWLQTMPISNVAMALRGFFPSGK